MATYAIGDIHGCSYALNALLEGLTLGPTDLVVTLGDYVDRGPDSRGVIDRLIRLRREVPLIALRGNHELMMLEARRDPYSATAWHECGGYAAVESYGGSLDGVPDAHWDFLESLVPYHETPDTIFVHAGVSPYLPLDRQSPLWLYWEPLEAETSRPHYSGKRVICGHTRQREGVPLDLGHCVCIDTSAYTGDFLTALDVESGRFVQADEIGRVRRGSLEELARGIGPA